MKFDNMQELEPLPDGELDSAGCAASPCSACADPLKRMEDHMEKLVAKMVEIREEMIAEEVDFRLVPLTHQDSGVILAVCESIGVDLIPMTPWSGSLFLDAQQLSQLNEAMAEFRQPNADVEARRQ